MNSGANSGWGEAPDEPAREDARPTGPEDCVPGLPGLRSWRAVYGVVLAIFALWIVLLAVLTRTFS